jgi:putative transposase
MFEPPRPKGGRPRVHSPRLLLDAILYVTREGCRWEAMPAGFPPWQTVYTARRRWMLDGTLERAIGALARA